MSIKKRQSIGIIAALSSAVFLGLAPIFGRFAITQSGFSPLAVVAIRTGLAALIVLIYMAIFKRSFLYIFPVGLIGCALAGSINGLGSLFYYMALEHLSASVGQLLYSLYPLFVALFSVLDKQPLTRMTMIRAGMALVAVFLLTMDGNLQAPAWAVLMMIGSAALYALHIPINQRVLFEIPAPTVTVYTLLAMSAVTVPAYLIFDRQAPPGDPGLWWPVLMLTTVTFVSRLALFLGIKNIGGTQTALLGLGELLITITLGHYMLNEKLSILQMVGAAILGVSLLLVRFDKSDHHRPKGGWLAWLHPPEVKIPWPLQD
jgi:drug/metabolite transporter (DMT)-like permease